MGTGKLKQPEIGRYDLLLGFLLGMALLIVFDALGSSAAEECNSQYYHQGSKPALLNAPANVLVGTGAQIGSDKGNGEVSKEKDGYKPTYLADCVFSPIASFFDRHEGFFLVIFTGVLAWFTLGLKHSTDKLYVAGENQLEAFKTASAEQAAKMEASNIAAQTAADAAEEQATSNRARVWVERGTNSPMIWGRDTNGDDSEIIVRFYLINYGNSPAIIAGHEFHMFWGQGDIDPESNDGVRWRDNVTWPRNDPNGIRTPFSTSCDVIEAKHISTIERMERIEVKRRFVFRGEAAFQRWLHQQPTMSDEAMKRFRSDEWFFVRFRYKDIYGVERETGYYSDWTGTRTSSFPQYNYTK